MRARITLLSVIGALVAAFAITAVSSANNLHGRTPINIRIDTGVPLFHGVIQSQRGKCERHRILVVKKQRPGPNLFVGADVTSWRGGWSVDANQPGTYIFKIDHRRRCGGDRKVITSAGQ